MTSALRHLSPSNKRQDSIAPWLKKSQSKGHATQSNLWGCTVQKRLVTASVWHPDQTGLPIERLEVGNQAGLLGSLLPHLAPGMRVRALFLCAASEMNVTFQNCVVKLPTRNGFKIFRVPGERGVRGLTRAGEGLGG